MSNNLEIRIPGAPHTYPIIYDEANGNTINETIKLVGLTGRRIALITDSTVAELEKAKNIILDLGLNNEQVLIFPAGEANKNRDTMNGLQDQLFQAKYGRDSAIIALGGGVTGDMAGLVADQHNRGVPLVQIPTTVLAQADSSIGGKVGIDVGDIKNGVGAFKQPDAVIVDTAWYETLTDEHYFNGMAETVKHGVLSSRDFFNYLLTNRDKIAARDPDIAEEIARNNCKIKRDVVQQDPEEKGIRKTLNYGHTAGHAIEAASNYNLPHGYCVAIGMQVAGKIAILLDSGFTKQDLDEQTVLLHALKLPIYVPSDLEIEQLLSIMKGDKKNTAGNINFTLPSRIGAMADYNEKWVTPVNEEIIRNVLEELHLKK